MREGNRKGREERLTPILKVYPPFCYTFDQTFDIHLVGVVMWLEMRCVCCSRRLCEYGLGDSVKVVPQASYRGVREIEIRIVIR